jgi:hypothetical protein
MRITAGWLLIMAALGACARGTSPAPHEIFDERTAGTLLVPGAPLVFARARSDVAAHARDYATLMAMEVDTSGDLRLYLILYRWSTVDPRMLPPPDPAAGPLKIIADGRVIELRPESGLPLNVGDRRELLVPNHGKVATRAYKVDAATLRFIATSRELIVRLPSEALDLPFTLWEDGRGALLQFLKRAGP